MISIKGGVKSSEDKLRDDGCACVCAPQIDADTFDQGWLFWGCACSCPWSMVDFHGEFAQVIVP